jgi:quinol-cytochrome oxidoreductase complex cytochrome b subunit
MIQSVLTWLDQRTGIVTMTKDFLTEDVPGGVSYWYTFGSATLIALVIQIVTGIFLTFYYSPSATTAWESTKFIYDKVLLGQFVLSLHYWGASAMIVLMTIHLLQTLVWGAYKKPREVQWVVGVLLFFVVLSMGLTGYLLPWDLDAYFATQVSVNIAGTVPMIGTAIANFLQDGSTMGTLTINRFYGLHVWLAPILILLLVGAHLTIFRHNGAAGPPVDEKPKKIGRFYPDQIFMDTVVSFIMFGIIALLAWQSPAPLLGKADPNNSTFVPTPAWYFYSLYGILNAAPASMELVATVVLPGVAVLLLLALPWIDRNPSRRWNTRWLLFGVTAFVMANIVYMSWFGAKVIGERQAASGYAGLTPVEGPGAVPSTPAPAGGATVANPAGEKLFSANCASCHGAQGGGTPNVAPALAGNPYVKGDAKAVILTIADGMHGEQAMGQSYGAMQMPAWKAQLTPAQIADVVSYIRGAWGNGASPVTTADVQAAMGGKPAPAKAAPKKNTTPKKP